MPGQSEIETGSATGRTLSPDFASVAFDDAARSRKTDTRTREIAGGMQTMKGPEQVPRTRGIKTGPVILDEEHRLVSPGHRANLNAGRFHLACEFPRITEQI